MGFKRRRSALDMLEAAHRRQEQMLHALEQEMPLDEATAALADALDFFLGPYRRHIADEEKSVLPRLQRAVALREQLHRDHEWQINLWKSLAAATSRGDRPKMNELALLLLGGHANHTALEDAQLLPAIEQLPAEARAEILDEMRERRGK